MGSTMSVRSVGGLSGSGIVCKSSVRENSKNLFASEHMRNQERDETAEVGKGEGEGGRRGEGGRGGGGRGKGKSFDVLNYPNFSTSNL